MSEQPRSASETAAEQAPEKSAGTDPGQLSEKDRKKLQAYLDEKNRPYTPRPKWQVIMAWVLLIIVILGVINICYWEITG